MSFIVGFVLMALNILSWFWVYRRLMSRQQVANWAQLSFLMLIKLVWLGSGIFLLTRWMELDQLSFGLGMFIGMITSILGGIFLQNFVSKR